MKMLAAICLLLLVAIPAMASQATQDVTIVISPPRIVITSTPPDCSAGHCFQGDAYSYQVVAQCNPGCVPPLSYSATSFPLSLTIDPVTGLVSGTLTDNQGSYSGHIVVTDANGNHVTQPLAPPKPQ